jgi:hypothetical protein
MKDAPQTLEWQIALSKWWYSNHNIRSIAIEDSFKAGWDAAIEAAAEQAETSEVLLPVEKFMGTKQQVGAAVAEKLAVEIRALSRPIENFPAGISPELHP